MKKILVVGGSNGIGLAITHELSMSDDIEKIYVVDKQPFPDKYKTEKIDATEFDLLSNDYDIFNAYSDINGLILTAGFGKLALFEDVDEKYIVNSFNVNTLSTIRIIKRFYYKMIQKEDFYCAVMVSISGFMSSPFFAIYGSTKAALKVFIESVNVELEKKGTTNRILNISPGQIKGTSFADGKTEIKIILPLAHEIIQRMFHKEDLFIPLYDEIFKEVLQRYHDDFRAEGRHSYEYKLQSGRVK